METAAVIFSFSSHSPRCPSSVPHWMLLGQPVFPSPSWEQLGVVVRDTQKGELKEQNPFGSLHQGVQKIFFLPSTSPRFSRSPPHPAGLRHRPSAWGLPAAPWRLPKNSFSMAQPFLWSLGLAWREPGSLFRLWNILLWKGWKSRTSAVSAVDCKNLF